MKISLRQEGLEIIHRGRPRFGVPLLVIFSKTYFWYQNYQKIGSYCSFLCHYKIKDKEAVRLVPEIANQDFLHVYKYYIKESTATYLS